MNLEGYIELKENLKKALKIVVVTKKPPMCRILRYHFIA